jgi:hypothetical protein
MYPVGYCSPKEEGYACTLKLKYPVPLLVVRICKARKSSHIIFREEDLCIRILSEDGTMNNLTVLQSNNQTFDEISI